VHLQDGSGAYATGKYRSLFAETGHSSAVIQEKIDAAYQQLFHGDPQSQAVFFSAGRNVSGHLAYVTDWANHDVRTEGMSYGMMMAVQMNKKDDFDALWNWTKTYMYAGNSQHPSYGYISSGLARRMEHQMKRPGAGWRGILCDVVALCRKPLGFG
jgi:oligosaccharide reducing-end xylanase